MTALPDPKKHLVGYGRQDPITGLIHGHIRWPHGTFPTPFGCRWCGGEQGCHGHLFMPRRGLHRWVQPTQAQIKARMLARRNARKAICHCPQGEDRPRPFAPVVDPYECEAVDCHGSFSELNPFGGGPGHGHDARVSRTCGCGWRTSVWHVADGSAEEELHVHVARVHGGTYEGELAMLRGLVRTLRVVVRPDEVDVGEVRRLLHEHDRDEATARDQAEATSAAQHFAAGRQEALDGHDPYRAQITGEDGRS